MSCWQLVLEYFKLGVDLVKGIAWPIAAILIALTFKDQIGSIIPRIRKASLSGLELDAENRQTERPPEIVVPLPSLAESNPALKEQEDRINQDLDLIDPGKKIPLLVRQLAAMQAARYFENCYGLIFGSQIELLVQLESRVSLSVAAAQLQFANEASLKFLGTSSDFNFENWIGFLLNRKLVQSDGMEYSLTALGKEFLFYLRSQDKAFNKAL